MLQAFVTKYSMADGLIKKVLGEVGPSDELYYRDGVFQDFAPRKYWHMTKRGAIAFAEKMRQEKVSELKKQIEYLENLTFKVQE